jgi:gliding motility-associated-like protein
LTQTFNAENPCSDLFVPSAFSPNGDGVNDTFFVYGSCISFMQLEVYSRWGEQVFISTAPSNGWDGTWRGKDCEAATFTYVLRGQMDDGTAIEMQGNLTLTR